MLRASIRPWKKCNSGAAYETAQGQQHLEVPHVPDFTDYASKHLDS